VSYLSGAGRGVLLIKLEEGDTVIGFTVARNDGDGLVVETSAGGEQRISPSKYELSSRGGRGREVIKRGTLTRRVWAMPAVPPALEGED
jgi:DNA gyrase subunit A